MTPCSFPDGEGAEEDCRDDDESVCAGAEVQPDAADGDGGAHVQHQADHHAQRRPHVHAWHAHARAAAAAVGARASS